MSFSVTVKQKQKKDSIFSEYSQKGNKIDKYTLEAIEKLHADKKLGNTNNLLIDNVEIVQSGKAAKKAPPMIITLK